MAWAGMTPRPGAPRLLERRAESCSSVAAFAPPLPPGGSVAAEQEGMGAGGNGYRTPSGTTEGGGAVSSLCPLHLMKQRSKARTTASMFLWPFTRDLCRQV